MKLLVILSTVFLLFSQIAFNANADADADAMRIAQKVVSAFECSALARIANRYDEADRLFSLGAQEGRIMVGGMDLETIKPWDRYRMPAGYAHTLDGPTADFVLGRMFENATARASPSIAGITMDIEAVRLEAENKLRQRNCELID